MTLSLRELKKSKGHGALTERLGRYHVGVKATSRTLTIAYLAHLSCGLGVLIPYDSLRANILRKLHMLEH